LGEDEGTERFIQTVHGRGYRFAAGVETLDGGEAAAATVASDPIPSPPTQASLAVLPFSDLSPGRDQGWFCEGVAEELIATLSEVRGLRVVSRASTSQFRDQDPRSIGERLRVAMLLTGSVRTAGNRLRITTQLVQVTAHLGEVDQALDLLESSLEDGAPRLVWIGVRPIFDPLREQPRFQRILDRMGLPNVRASAAPRR
jgi:TolB-like protein